MNTVQGATQTVPTGHYWYSKYLNSTDPKQKARLDSIYGFSKMQPAATTAATPATTSAAPATTSAAPATTSAAPATTSAATPATATPAATDQPPYFNYVVPGHGNTTQGLKDTAGDTWYKTQGNQWRNTRTHAVSATLPTWQATPPPAAPAPAPAPAVPTAPTSTPPAPGIFRSARDFVVNGENPYGASVTYNDLPAELRAPNSYDQSLYDWQADQGLKKLRASLSADGGISSGAQGQMTSDFLNQLGAQEADRRQKMIEAGKDRGIAAWTTAANSAEAAKNRQATAAGSDQTSYIDQQNTEANRQIIQGNSQWSRIMDVLNTILGQSPVGSADAATANSSSLISGLGDALAKLEVMQGQPGGQIPLGPAPVAQVPTPNYGASAAGAQNSVDWTNLFTNIVGMLNR